MKHRRLTKSACFAAGLLSAATTSHAQEIRGVTIPLGVYDASNTWLGTYSGSNGGYSYALRPYGGTWYQIAFSRLGIVDNAYFFYVGTGCVGQKFLYVSDEVPPALSFDGTALWAPSNSSEEQIVSVGSYSYAGGQCYSYPTPYNAIFGVATKIDAKGNAFVAPFTVR